MATMVTHWTRTRTQAVRPTAPAFRRVIRRMDLIPKPDQVVSAASNVAHKLLYGGLADLRPMPRTLIDEGELREVYHYRPAATAREQGDPVLLVTPLAAPALCFDLRRGCSLVEHFVATGRPTYLVEYGEVSFKNRALGMEHWVDEVVPAAIQEVSQHAGGRPVHLVGWSLGGIFALLDGRGPPDLPIASVTVGRAPVDVSQVPLVAPLRPLLNLTDGGVRDPALPGCSAGPRSRWCGGPSSSRRSRSWSPSRSPIAHPPRRHRLPRPDRGGRPVHREHDRLPGPHLRPALPPVRRGATRSATGRSTSAAATIDLADITAPVLVFAGATDGIAPIDRSRRWCRLLTGAREVRFEIVPGGHLGMLTGRAARGTTWRVLDEWIDQWSSDAPEPTPEAPAGTPAPRKEGPAGEEDAPRRSHDEHPTKPAKKRAPKKSAAKTAATGKPVARPRRDRRRSPTRRYGSATSRSLARDRAPGPCPAEVEPLPPRHARTRPPAPAASASATARARWRPGRSAPCPG